jgi:hypothetical protein
MDASRQVMPSSSVISDHRLHERPNIIKPDEDELVDQRLLDHLTEMSQALSQTHHGDWMRDDRIRAIMCRELLTVGYDHIKAKMERGEMPLGDLHYGSARMFLKIGPVSEFITPVEDVEHLWCWNQKALEIMERWPSFDDFFDVWSEVLNRASCSWDRIIFVREYRSNDFGMKSKYPTYPSTNIVSLDRNHLEKYWSRASERVDAMKLIDQLKSQFRREIQQENIMRRRYDEEQIGWLRNRDSVENHRNGTSRTQEREEYWRRDGHYHAWRYHDRNVRRRFV